MIKGYKCTLYGNYRQESFSEIWESANDFLNDYTSIGIPTSISNDDATNLYYLLYTLFYP